MSEHSFFIPKWRPTQMNQMLYKPWYIVRRMKKSDHDIIAYYWKESGLPNATMKRRLSLKIMLKPRGREGDYDGQFKCLLDGLVLCSALVDDSPQWCEQNPVIEYERSTAKAWGTWITLQDMEAENATWD